ncbi:MAG: electron transfer flavoprotein subunit alpha, partial [Candidatus Bathyarchaeia archaeon]
MSEAKSIWVFSENLDLALEMLGKAREIADKRGLELAAVVIGRDVQSRAEELVKHGADKVYLVDNPALERFQADPYLSILHNLVITYKPEILLVGSTKNGKPLAARLALRLD